MLELLIITYKKAGITAFLGLNSVIVIPTNEEVMIARDTMRYAM